MNLRNAHIVVTGGGTGVGAAIAANLADADARITVMGRTEASLKQTGLHYQCCDVSDAQAVQSAFANARQAQGPIAAVIANAGAAESVPFAKMQTEDLQHMLGVNLIGVFNVWQAALPDLIAANSGRLVAVASTAGLKGYPYVSGYCAAKHAVVGLTRSLALELATSGITVNAVCPGFIDTPLLDRAIQRIVEKTGKTHDDALMSLTKTNPQKRLVKASEVASAVRWLCSADAQSVNGHTMSLSGGEI